MKKTTSSKTSKTKWAVMRVFSWKDITLPTLDNRPLKAQYPKTSPSGFIPVFNSYAAAVAWVGSDDQNTTIVALDPIPQTP